MTAVRCFERTAEQRSGGERKAGMKGLRGPGAGWLKAINRLVGEEEARELVWL